jgi:hypothetical protein
VTCPLPTAVAASPVGAAGGELLCFELFEPPHPAAKTVAVATIIARTRNGSITPLSLR